MLIAIWGTAAGAYLAFHAWYVGFRGKLTPAEVDAYCARLAGAWEADKIAQLRTWLAADTGREFYMVNVLRLNRSTPSGESPYKVLLKYQRPFMAAILKRAGHPIAMARASAPSLELWGIANAGDWDFAALVRYRSRRDMAETLLLPNLHEIRNYKHEALAKTFAFPGDPARILFGGPRLVVALALVALAALASMVVLA